MWLNVGILSFYLYFLLTAVSYDQGVAYPPPQPFSGQQFFSDPVASMAMQYGSNLAGQGKEHVHKNVSSICKCLVFPSLEHFSFNFYDS